MQFDMVKKNPYKYTSDDVLFIVHALRKEIPENEWTEAREVFFSKGQACLRASPLTKRYGWGVHSDKDGKVALYACGSPEYRQFAEDKTLKVVKAMKSSR